LPRHGQGPPDASPTAAPFPKRASPSLHRRTRQTMVMTEYHRPTDTPPHTPEDPDNARAVKPTLAPVSLGSALQLQLRLDNEVNGHDGDDEQDYDDPERSLSRSSSSSRSYSSLPQVPTPPVLQHQQPTPTPTPPPNPFGAHVHFHSRVRITSGLRHHSHGNPSLGAGDSSDSDSPSSSISAPLRYRSQDSVPRLPLGQRVSRLAAQALQKRRMAATVTSSANSRRLRTRTDQEYTPFLRTGVPVTYGSAPHGDDRRPQIGDMHGEDAVTFGRWPWRLVNRQVSSGRPFVRCDTQFAYGPSIRSVVEVAN
jgi:hypothetical protein